MLTSTAVLAQSQVYFTREITPESLVKIYKALGVEATGRVAVKISTGEGGNTHYLKPTLIRQLVEEVNGTIVECCTAYPGTRMDPKKHWETIHEHGFDSIFAVDLMDGSVIYASLFRITNTCVTTSSAITCLTTTS